MTNPFKKKVEAYTFSAKGLGRTFKVTTADGKKYYTNRRDYIYIGWEYNNARCLSLKKIVAQDLLETGIKEGIRVAELNQSKRGIWVQPIKVEQVHSEEIDLVETYEDTRRPIWRDAIKFWSEDNIKIQQTVLTRLL